ncbi:hypothetical protein PMAYCL1PPCAC_21910, partial [Pristionchus mayeri]
LMISFDDDLSDFRRDEPSEDIFGPPSSSSSKLASLFEDDSVAAPVESKPALKPTTSQPRPSTLFSSVVHIFVPDPATAEYTSFGRGGVALISLPDTKTLLLYTASKAVLTQLPILPSISLSVSHPYVYFTALDGKKWSIAFDNDIQLWRILAWYLLLTESTTVFDLSAGVETASIVEEGDALLVGLTSFTANGEELKLTEESDVKLRLSSRKHKHDWEKHLTGLRKGAIRMAYSSATVTLLTIKKVRRQRESDSEPRTVESSDLPKDTVSEDTVSTITVHDTVSEPATESMPDESIAPETTVPHATVLARMAKLGKPMLGLAELSTVIPPTIDTPPTVSSSHIEPASAIAIDEATVAQGPATVAQSIDPLPQQPSYADFHRVIGLEMDRLQIRLEASFSRMLQESLGPIRDQLSRLEENQERILQKLQTTP